jgi:hypothetical protein
MLPNTAHMLQFTPSGLWSPTHTMHLQLHIFRIQYTTQRICAATWDMSTVQCWLYCKHGAKYGAHPPVYAMWTVVADTYNVITARHIQASIFNWTYLRCYRRYLDNAMLVIPKPWCQLQRTSYGLRYVIGSSGHIQCIYSAYSGFNIQLNVSALLLEISRHCKARYTANFVPNTAHILQFTLRELWSRIYTKHLHLQIFRIQYTTQRICAAIGDISTIQCSLYCKLGAY